MSMKKIIIPRQTGKTTRLIELSERTAAPILCADLKRALFVAKLAEDQGRHIPNPITVNDVRIGSLRGLRIQNILIDDADAVLTRIFGVTIDAITMTSDTEDIYQKSSWWQRIKAWFREPWEGGKA